MCLAFRYCIGIAISQDYCTITVIGRLSRTQSLKLSTLTMSDFNNGFYDFSLLFYDIYLGLLIFVWRFAVMFLVLTPFKK